MRRETGAPFEVAASDCEGRAIDFAAKDVLVALLATCLPLPSLSLAFCEG